MHTHDFRRLFVGFVMADTLVAMRLLDRKQHSTLGRKLIELEDEPFGQVIVVGGNDISDDEALFWCKAQKDEAIGKGSLPSEYYNGLVYDNQQ